LLNLHCTDVADDHDPVAQTMAEGMVDAVKSNAPKFKPDTVTQAPPVPGTFMSTWDMTDASKVKKSTMVPAAAATVTATSSRGGSANDLALQATDEAELHDKVEQTASEKAADTVKSAFPKFNPVTVTEALAVRGRLTGDADKLGPSKEYRAKLVPAMEATVNAFDDKPNAA
jgi:hypothetical protein